MWAHTKESQAKILPAEALEYLREGNRRFRNNLKLHRNLLQQVNQTAEGQFPFATILSCIDSRTSAELIFDQGLGDIFSIRIAGNIINEDILGSMEYSCAIAHAKIIVVLGHTQCGAIISACNNVKQGHFSGLLRKIAPAIEKAASMQKRGFVYAKTFYNRVSIHNIHLSIHRIREESPILHALEQEGKILIVGALYDIESGKVTFLDAVKSA